MKYFTGLKYLQFIALFNFLGPAVNNLKYWYGEKRDDKETDSIQHKRSTSPLNELFIMLVRLRRGYDYYAMSHFFCMSESTLRSIFDTWLQFLYFHFKGLKEIMFPSRDHFKQFLPKCFKGFKNVRCVIDCTEFFVQQPRDFQRQGNLYSSYKHHCTYKCLIAVAPNGCGVFVSDLYEGSISDREIFEQCGILDHVNAGDLIIVDRGFTVKDLLQAKGAHMNIPPFLNGRAKLTPQEVLLTQRIAKARVHVERYNERIKKFRLISGIMPLNLSPVANQAVFVACCLTNFQDQLVK